MTDQMRRSYLIQRLTKPRGAHPLLGADNPFAFGGGLRNGGLSDNAMDLLRPIFGFDYMGSAEFEFGAVPEALQRIAKAHRSLIASSVTVARSDVDAGWRLKRDAEREDRTGDAEVYFIAPREWAGEVASRITSWALKSPHADMKEDPRLGATLLPVNEWDTNVIGWLEISNGFFFFVSEDAWRATCDLFGVEVPAVTA